MSVAHRTEPTLDDLAASPGRDTTVRCRACRAEVTSTDLVIARGGGHERTFRNPAGYSWRIATFRDAPGCRSEGELTSEASWFDGYRWCFASCGACGTHLGWWYVGDGPSFVGLITTRLDR